MWTPTCSSPREIAGNRDPWGCCGGARGRDRSLRLPVTRERPRTFPRSLGNGRGFFLRPQRAWIGMQDPRALQSDRRGSDLRRLASRPDCNPGYVLDFSLGCRCQGVGNWELPGGVMSMEHPPRSLATPRIWHRKGGCSRAKSIWPARDIRQRRPYRPSGILPVDA